MTQNNLNDLYCFVNDDKEDWSYVKILSGSLEGAIIKFNKIGFDEDEGEDFVTMKMDYDWIEKPKHLPSKKTISNTLGQIASDIIINHVFSD